MIQITDMLDKEHEDDEACVVYDNPATSRRVVIAVRDGTLVKVKRVDLRSMSSRYVWPDEAETLATDYEWLTEPS